MAAFADLLRYNAYRFFSINNALFEMTWIPMGILAFVLLLLASYLYHLKEVIASKTEQNVLAAMVYIDSLTGLYNRTKSSQIFDVLNKSNEDFAVVSIDMNGLKFVNDKYGHIVGDSLIKAFSKVFRQAFDGVGTTIRMGGDEFIAIVRKEHLLHINEALLRLKSLQSVDSEKLPVRLEAAYGVAYRSELDNATADDVYQAADTRMYEMKKSMKSELVRR